MSKFGGIPVSANTGSRFGGSPVEGPSLAHKRYQAEDDARRQENENANVLQQFGTGVKTQAGRTMLGLAEFLNNATGDSLFDPEVLAEALHEADRRDAGTGAAGLAGNLIGDFRNYLPVGGVKAIKGAKTLRQAIGQGAKVGAISGGITGATEGTGDADSTLLTNAGNAAIGAGLGATIGGAVPATIGTVKAGGKLVQGGVDRSLAALGSDNAAERVAYRNIAKILEGQGYQPGEVASIIDEFQAQNINGGTLGQILESSDLLAREKNLLQGGGEAGRIMGERLKDTPKNIADSIISRVSAHLQPEQTSYLYKQAADVADAAPGRVTDGVVTTMGQSASAKELPFTVAAIGDDIAERLPNETGKIKSALERIQKNILAKAQSGKFEDVDNAKKMLDDMFVENPGDYEQRAINNLVSGYRKMLNESLEQAGGEVYTAAKGSAQRDMAIRDIIDAVKNAQGQSVKATLNKFFGTLEKQEEFFRKLPDEARQEFMTYLENLQKVTGRFGGSDTFSNNVAGKAMNAESGFGFDANVLSPQAWIDRLSAPISRNVRKAQAEATFSPNVQKLRDEMTARLAKPTTAPNVGRLLSNEATKASVPAAVEPDLPYVDLPTLGLSPEQQPQSNAAPLIERFAQAESSSNPNAKNDQPGVTSSGLLGFNDDTWVRAVSKWGKQTGIGLKDKSDPEAQKVMGELLAKDNTRILTNKLGRPITDGETYVAHALGAADAVKLINAQGTGKQAIMLFPRKIVSVNRPWFYDGKRPRTVEEMYELLTSKVA